MEEMIGVAMEIEMVAGKLEVVSVVKVVRSLVVVLVLAGLRSW